MVMVLTLHLPMIRHLTHWIYARRLLPGVILTGTYRAGDFSAIYGKDPANGAWSVVITDCNYNVFSPTDGEMTMQDLIHRYSYLGYLETVMYESGPY